MARKKMRANKKTAQKKVTVVDNNEEAFLNFVDQHAKQISGSDESNDVGFGNINSDSESSSSSSLGEISRSFHVEGSSSSSDEAAVDMALKKPAKKRGRPPKKRNLSKTATDVKAKSSKGLSSSSGKEKQSEKPNQDPQYNKKELKAALAVVKKLMEMDEAVPFSAPVDPVSLGIPDYFDVVDTPMDLGTICTNFQNGVKYMNAEDVYKDVQYIWENCLKYNKKGDYIVYLMKRVKKKFTKYWRAAGLKSETLRKDAGIVPSNDCAMRHDKDDPISVMNHVVGNLNQLQHDNFGTVHPQPQVPLLNYSQPYQSHQSQPGTTQRPQVSELQAGIDGNYAGHSHVVNSDDCGNPPYVHINDRGMRRRTRKVTSMATTMVGSPSQMQQDGFDTIQPESQVPLSSYSRPHKPHQPQPSTTLPPHLPQLHTGTERNSHLVHSDDRATRNSRHDASSMVNHTVGNPSQMQQDNFSNIQPQSQVPLPSYSQSYQLHQHQPTTTQLPQVFQLQDGADGNNTGHSNMKRRKYETRSSVATMMSGPAHSNQQQPQLRSYYLRQSQQSTCQPQPSQSHSGADIDNVDNADNAGYPRIVPPMDTAMGHNGFVPRCPVDPMVASPNELQPQLSHCQPNGSQKLPHASIGQPQPSQAVASVDISTAEHSCLRPANPSKMGRTPVHRISTDLGPDISLVSSHSQPPQPLACHNHPNQVQQPAQKSKKNRQRGPTMCRDMWDMRDGERIVVPTNMLGQPVGPEASKLSTFLGTVARNGEMAPLNCVGWYSMPDENKVAMWQFVQTRFDIDPMCKPWVLKSIAAKWRNWKSKLKADHYNPYKTDEERLRDCDKRVLPDQWRILVSYWNSEEAQVRSAKNKANRAKHKSAHTAGQKSFARICEEERAKRPDGKEPTKAELYIKTRTRKDGTPVNKAAAEMISKLREETPKQQASDGGNESEDAFVQVMEEEKSGHKKGKKHGCIELTTMKSQAKSSSNEEVSKMLNKMEAMEQKYASMEAQIARMTSNMQNFLDKIGEPSKALGTKQVPSNPSAPEDSLQAEEHSSSSSHAVPSDEEATPFV